MRRSWSCRRCRVIASVRERIAPARTIVVRVVIWLEATHGVRTVVRRVEARARGAGGEVCGSGRGGGHGVDRCREAPIWRGRRVFRGQIVGMNSDGSMHRSSGRSLRRQLCWCCRTGATGRCSVGMRRHRGGCRTATRVCLLQTQSTRRYGFPGGLVSAICLSRGLSLRGIIANLMQSD